jgi:hypothetical protein
MNETPTPHSRDIKCLPKHDTVDDRDETRLVNPEILLPMTL